jgi:hypothetical protein
MRRKTDAAAGFCDFRRAITSDAFSGNAADPPSERFITQRSTEFELRTSEF